MAVSTLAAATSSRASAEPLDQGLYVTPHRICSAVTKPLRHGPHHRLKVEVWVGKVEVTQDEPGGLVQEVLAPLVEHLVQLLGSFL